MRWGLLFFILFLLLIFGAAGWVVYTQLRARRQGLPAPTWKSYIPFMSSESSSTNYPTPRSANPLEWIKDQIDKLRNKRTARGAYEETSGNSGLMGSGGGSGRTGARVRGRGVEDDAWDTRVAGREEDPYGGDAGLGYEEQELGLAPTPGLQSEPYGGASDYIGSSRGGGGYYGDGGDRGRSHQRGQSSLGVNDPFGDQNEAASLRSVSPRPDADARGHAKGQGSLDSQLDVGGSPTSTRKSAFREGI